MLAAWEIKPEFSPAPAGWLARLPARLLAPLSAGLLASSFDAGDVHAI
jgi:hypothetical protein